MSEGIVRLPEGELVRLRGILLDEDEAEALSFLKEHCSELLERMDAPHCVPEFEESYGSRKCRLADGASAEAAESRPKTDTNNPSVLEGC
ncbi:MAG: hypothetical protein C4521_07255 [Actinobacteria bacterium]|nr:MAG: hypothetical protein C4521_07255 [Actinomycetota bacterium]